MSDDANARRAEAAPRLGGDLTLSLDLDALRLTPEVEAAAQQRLRRLLQPEDLRLDAPTLARLLPEPAVGAAPPPKPGDMAAVLGAVMAQPEVKQLAAQLEEHLRKSAREIERSWKRADGGERVLMVAAAVLVGGGFSAAVAGADPLRRLALDALKGRDIALPGLDGVSVKLLDHGAALTLTTAAPSLKLTVSAHGFDGAPQYGVMLNLDLMKLLPGKPG